MKTTHQLTNPSSSIKHTLLSSVFAVAGLLLSSPLQAGGSVSFSEIKTILPAAVRDHLEGSFRIADSGNGTRLGRHFTHLAGERIGPYEFVGVSRTDPDATFKITINTSVMFLNRFGRQNQNAEDAVDISESYESHHTELTNTDDHTYQGPPLPPEKTNRETAIQTIRNVYNEVQGMNLPLRKREFESETGLRGTIAAGKTGGTVRKLKLDVIAGDHGGFDVEIFYYANQLPAFILWTDHYWGFNPQSANETIDYIKEYRLYYTPEGELVRALEKSYQGNHTNAIRAGRDNAPNREITTHEPGVFELRKNAANLALPGRTANPGRTVEDLLDYKNILINGQ